MAAVTVFVDDAVLGRMPYVCAKTGAPAEGLLTVRRQVNGPSGLLWLLLLLGPVGLAAMLVILLLSRGDDILTVQVPWSEAAQHDLDHAQRRRRTRWYACLGLLGAALVVNWISGGAAVGGEMAAVLLFGAALVALAAIGAGVAVGRASIDVRLDASRRWVTLGDVHNDFAHAVETSRSGRQPAAP